MMFSVVRRETKADILLQPIPLSRAKRQRCGADGRAHAKLYGIDDQTEFLALVDALASATDHVAEGIRALERFDAPRADAPTGKASGLDRLITDDLRCSYKHGFSSDTRVGNPWTGQTHR